MNILMLNSRDAGGGAAGIARKIGEGYAAAGHRVHWLVGFKTRASDPEVTEIAPWGDAGLLGRFGPRIFSVFRRAPGTIHLSRMRWRRALQALHPGSTAAALQGREDFRLSGLRRALAQLPFTPDVIHAHNLHGFNHLTHFDLARLAELSRRVPTLVTLHDPWLVTGHCAHFFDCDRWQSGCGSCPRLDVYPKLRRDGTAENWKVKSEVYRRARFHAVGVCNWVTEVARRSILAPSLRSSRTIENGVDLATFRPVGGEGRLAARKEFAIPDDAWVIAYASELGERNPYRDFTSMREACRTLAEELAPRAVVAIELGGDIAGTTSLGRLRIVSTGFVSPARVIACLQSSDVLLHAARADTSPTIVFEAMACGAPVVGTGVCGIPEQIDPEVSGLVTESGASAMAEALRVLAGDPGRRDRMGAAARRRAEAFFDERRMQRRYVETVTEVAASPTLSG